MNNLLKTKFPYLTNFFQTALRSENACVANSIILYGMDVLAQYYLALNLAKELNCTGDKSEDCDCINCSWIKSNKHPAVMTISKVDNKNDSSKSVISKDQVDMVRDLLVNTSDYHRVFIFCDADFKQLSESELSRIESFGDLKINLPSSESQDSGWFPKGLTRACFQDVAANSLLKSIEEPPCGVTFVFLTEDKNDLIQTVVSRSQCFYVPSFVRESSETSFLSGWLDEYPNLDKSEALRFSKHLYDYQIKEEIRSESVLNAIQNYLGEFVRANLSSKNLVNKTIKDIEKIEVYKKMLASYVKEQSVYDEIAFYFFCN